MEDDWRTMFEEPQRDRRKSLTSRTSYRVKTLRERHKRIAELAASGMSNVDIAQTIGITPVAVSGILSNPMVQDYVDMISAAITVNTRDVITEIENLVPKCLDYLYSTINDETVSAGIKSSNAKHIMGLGGYVPVKKVDIRSVSARLGQDELRMIKEYANKMKVDDPKFNEGVS